MIVVIENHGEEEFQYESQKTVNDVRAFAAEKLQLQPTNVNVRKHKCQNSLPNGKTLSELGLATEDVLVVRKTVRNNEGNAKKKFQSGKTCSSKKYDVSKIMVQAKNNHVENYIQSNLSEEIQKQQRVLRAPPRSVAIDIL